MSSSQGIHPTAAAMYWYIVRFKEEHDGNSPSVREIADRLDIPSTSTVVYHLRKLQTAGRITMEPGKVRRIAVVGARWVVGGE